MHTPAMYRQRANASRTRPIGAGCDEAGALRAFGSPANRAALAAEAGMDLILCSGQQVGEGVSAASALAHSLASGRSSTAGFAASVQRVLALRATLR